jgi:sugar phosphate isomerase/epimerase
MNKLGVYADDLSASPKVSMELAARLGLPLIQLQAVRGELAPHSLSQSGRRHVLRYARDHGLAIVALGTELRLVDSGDADRLDRQVAQTCAVLELARELHVPLVGGPVSDCDDQPRSYELLRQALHQIAEQADRVNCPFAVQTTRLAAATLDRVLRELNCRHLRICYDPGEFLISGQDPLTPIEAFADDIALVHLRDATLAGPRRSGQETRLGQGQLDIAACVQRLGEAGYRGALLLRRTQGADPVADIAAAKAWLEAHLRW